MTLLFLAPSVDTSDILLLHIAAVFILNVFHLQLKCCGANSSSDWRFFGPDGNSVPDSCCVKVVPKCGVGAMTDAAKVHQEVNGMGMTFQSILNKYINK